MNYHDAEWYVAEAEFERRHPGGYYLFKLEWIKGWCGSKPFVGLAEDSNAMRWYRIGKSERAAADKESSSQSK